MMKRKKITTAICIVSLALFACVSVNAQAPTNPFEGFEKLAKSYQTPDGNTTTGIRYLDIPCIRQKGNRDFSYPIQGHKIIANPPVLTWPMDDYNYPDTFPYTPPYRELSSMSKYKVQLSRSKDFSANTRTVENLSLAFYHPHKKLSVGKWFWRYAVVKDGNADEWSATESFEITKEIPVFESPYPKEAYKMIADGHPRILKALAIKKPTADKQKLVKLIKGAAEKAFRKTVTSYKVKGKEIPADATSQEIRQIKSFLVKAEVLAVSKSIESLLTQFRLTGEDRFAEKAMELGNMLLMNDPVETYHKTDFGGASSMKSLAKIYDVCYDKLTDEKRKNYENYVGAVLKLILNHAINSNVGSDDGILFAHFFQHTFYDSFIAAMVMKNHIPYADTAFEILYEIWLARTPGGGFLEDGNWPNGNIAYLHTNMNSMVDMYLLYKKMFQVNLFQHPWYHNASNTLAYTIPPNSWGDGFGDGAEKRKLNAYRAPFAYILGQELNNPFAMDYAYALSGLSSDKDFAFKRDYFAAYRLQHTPKKMAKFDEANIPQAAVFPQTGSAIMHTDLMHTKKNLMVSFRSSPFGVGSHGHAEHNSFNIIYKGSPIFYPTGYRVTTQDKHYLLSQKHSRAKNTISVDGKTQGFAYDSYGWIPRFLHGEEISYVMGDASQAYKKLPKSSINWQTVLENVNAYTSNEGFIITDKDDPNVTLFRRHLVLLRPNVVVVYDELEAAKPVTWTLQLNGLQRANFSLDADANTLKGNIEDCDAQAEVFASCALESKLIDTNYIKPFDWLNPQRGRPAIQFEKQQYQGAFQNKEKQQKMRFLTVIRIDGKGAIKQRIQPNKKGEYIVEEYKVKATLATDKPARLEVENKKSGAYLLYGPTEKSNKAKKRKYSHSTVLIEKGIGFQEAIDTYPLMVPEKFNK